MKSVYYVVLVIFLIVATFIGYSIYTRSGDHESFSNRSDTKPLELLTKQESKLPKHGDLCGGTGGIGQIVSIGKDTITVKRKDGKNLVTHLTKKTAIHLATGSAAMSDLKPGDKVTLVGGPSPDGGFDAEALFVCNAEGSSS